MPFSVFNKILSVAGLIQDEFKSCGVVISCNHLLFFVFGFFVICYFVFVLGCGGSALLYVSCATLLNLNQYMSYSAKKKKKTSTSVISSSLLTKGFYYSHFLTFSHFYLFIYLMIETLKAIELGANSRSQSICPPIFCSSNVQYLFETSKLNIIHFFTLINAKFVILFMSFSVTSSSSTR